jgi:hemerythrin-like domain-containing protein
MSNANSNNPSTTAGAANTGEPLNEFSECHAGILSQLQALGELPVLAAEATRARAIASDSLALFKHAVIDHHAEEESELFPAVLRSAQPGEEHDLVQVLISRLTSEHRTMEALWKRLEPAISATAKGKDAELQSAEVAELVSAYSAHARFEETQFLPLAETILGRNANHMAALGLSLHMRHAKISVGFI